jgi:hypothetical protein
MKINISNYILNKPIVQGWWRRDKDIGLDLPKCIAAYAVATHCPCIVIAHFIAEDIGYTPAINDQIESLTKFYGYED